MRARSSELMLLRMPSPTSCWGTQSLRIYGTQPILGGNDFNGGPQGGVLAKVVGTMRTARWRTFGEKSFDFLLVAPSSQSVEPPQNQGAI